jgi:transcriptional regulator with XRE-family HTH domain
MEMVAVGVYLQQCRKAAGLTQEKVGSELGVSPRTVSDWEAGRYVPSFDLMARLVRIVGASIETVAQLLLGNGPPRPSRDPELDAIIAMEYERKQGHGQERMRAAHVLEDLIDHPDLIDQWLDYGEYLLTRLPNR